VEPEIIEVWMQHPARAFLNESMFESLQKWSYGDFAPGELPLEWTIMAMDEGGVRVGMLCAWWGPRGTSDLKRYGFGLLRRSLRLCGAPIRTSSPVLLHNLRPTRGCLSRSRLRQRQLQDRAAAGRFTDGQHRCPAVMLGAGAQKAKGGRG
jgi:hypothetical protein